MGNRSGNTHVRPEERLIPARKAETVGVSFWNWIDVGETDGELHRGHSGLSGRAAGFSGCSRWMHVKLTTMMDAQEIE